MTPAQFTPAQILAQNLKALLQHGKGPRTQMELARKAQVGQATIGRILRADTAATVETIAALSAVYDLEAWQLLVAGMEPSNPPALIPVTAAERRLYARLRDTAREIAELPAGYIVDRDPADTDG